MAEIERNAQPPPPPKPPPAVASPSPQAAGLAWVTAQEMKASPGGGMLGKKEDSPDVEASSPPSDVDMHAARAKSQRTSTGPLTRLLRTNNARQG